MGGSIDIAGRLSTAARSASRAAGEQHMVRPERGRHGTPRRPAEAPARGLWLYGRHAVEAALANPQRSCHRLLATAEALARLGAGASASRPRGGDRRARRDRPQARRRRGSPGPGALGRSPAAAGPAAGLRARARPQPGADARPDQRSAQCRRDPAHRRGVRGARRDHGRAAGGAAGRRGGQGGLGRSGSGAGGRGRQPRPRARRPGRPGLLADRAGWPCRADDRRRARGRQPRAGARRRGRGRAPPGARALRFCRAPADRAGDGEPERLGRLRHRALCAGGTPGARRG